MTQNNEALIDKIKSAIDNDDNKAFARELAGLDINNINIPIKLDGNDRAFSLLFYASLKGAINCFKYLVEEKGVDLYFQNENGSIFLHWLGERAINILDYAIEKKVDIDFQNHFKYSPLYGAAMNGHLAVMELLINSGAEVDLPNSKGWMPLHAAAMNGHLIAADILITKGANVNYSNNGIATPLYLAAHDGHLEVVKLLINKKAYVNFPGTNDQTPLHAAAQNGHFKVVELLINSGAKVDLPDADGWMPLHVAAKNGHFKAVELLINSEAKVDLPNSEGWTPLLIAVEYGHLAVVELLINKGAKVDFPSSGGWRPLHIAAQNGHFKVVECLINSGAKVDLPNSEGWMPLHIAAENGYLAIIEILISKGANVEISNSNNQSTPLHIAAYNGHFAVVELLINKGAKVDLPNSNGWMPLHIAAQNGHFKVVECLINKGAKVDLPSSEGFVPLHIAAQNGHFKVVELLINSGAKVDLPDADGWMPLHAAAQNGHFKVVELLINSGAKVDLPKSNGWMPLHIAAQNGHFKVVECLINKGAKVDLPDFQGLRPLHIAAGKGKLNCILVNEKLKKEGKPEFDIPSEQQYKNCAKAILLSHKVDISAKDENERNVYDIAHENGYDEIFQLIKLYESFYDLIKGKIQHDTLQKMTTSSELQEFFKDLSLTYFFANNIKLSNQIIDEYLNKLKLAEDAFNDNNQKSSFNKLLNQVKTKLAADEAEMVANIIAIETLIVETYDPVFFDIILQNTMERGNGLSNKWSIKKVATNYIGNVSNLGLIGRKYKADSEEFEGEAYGEGIILERLLSIISDVEPLSNNLLTSFSELFTKVKYNLSKELKAKGEEFIKLATDMEAISVIEEADEAYTGNIVKQSLDESEPLNQIGQVFVAQHELYIE